MFTRHWADLDFWDEFLSERDLPRDRPIRILEIGALEGLTTCYLLHQLDESNHTVDVTVIDTWQGSREHHPDQPFAMDFAEVEARFDENLRRILSSVSPRHRLTKLRSTSLTALARLITSGARFDLIFIDGSHEAFDVLADAVLAIELAEVGGTIVFDDYNWLRIADDQTLGAFFTAPRVAIDAALNINRHRLVVVGPRSLNRLTLERQPG